MHDQEWVFLPPVARKLNLVRRGVGDYTARIALLLIGLILGRSCVIASAARLLKFTYRPTLRPQLLRAWLPPTSRGSISSRIAPAQRPGTALPVLGRPYACIPAQLDQRVGFGVRSTPSLEEHLVRCEAAWGPRRQRWVAGAHRSTPSAAQD